MNIAGLTIEQALASVNGSAYGLSSAQARRRLQEFGPNRIEKVRGLPIWLRFVREFSHLFALVLWVAAGLAFLAEHQQPGQGMAELGFAIIGVIVINGVFSFWQEYRAERALAALRRLLPRQVKVLRDGKMRTVSAERLVPGDVVLLVEGDHVPADCRLIEAFSVRVNLATLTGESVARMRTAEPHAEASAVAARNLLLAGTSLVSGEARAVVYSTGMKTEFGRIAHLTQTAGEASSPLQREISRLSRIVAFLSILLGVGFFFVGQVVGLSSWESFMFGIGIIVAAVPEGLMPTVTLALAMATQRMARRNALVRHLPSVETLGSTTVILADKTGTLTRNHMTLRRIYAGGTHFAPDQFALDCSLPTRHSTLLQGMRVCNNVHPTERSGRSGWTGDPMEVALVEFAQRFAAEDAQVQLVSEIPFDSDRRRMSVICRSDGALLLHCKGALESLLRVATYVDHGPRLRRLDQAECVELLRAQERMARDGLRVLAFGYRLLVRPEEAAETGLVICGLAGIEDPLRPEVPAAIDRCHEAGIRVIMVTGDHPSTALAVGREIGLIHGDKPAVIRGEHLARMSPTELQLALESPDVLFARVSAEQKMHIVQALQAKGDVVAVTGDGVNDAPALKAADIGIAMGVAGTDVAREAADMVLLDDNFASIVAAIEEGRAMFHNIRKFLTYILTSNVPQMVPYLLFAVFRIPLPLTVIQILAVDLGTDMIPALALGAEKPDPSVMREPPRPRNERLLNWKLLGRAYLWLGLLEAAIAMAAFFHVLVRTDWCYGTSLPTHDLTYLQATTATLAGIVVAQVINAFNCRHPTESAFRFGLFANKLLLLGVVVGIGLLAAIAYTPAGNQIFGTAPLPLEAWFVIVPLALVMLFLEETRKWLVRVGRGAKRVITRREPAAART